MSNMPLRVMQVHGLFQRRVCCYKLIVVLRSMRSKSSQSSKIRGRQACNRWKRKSIDRVRICCYKRTFTCFKSSLKSATSITTQARQVTLSVRFSI